MAPIKPEDALKGPAYCCPICLAEGVWQLLRVGDVVVSWSCEEDISEVLREMQRDDQTEIIVTQRQPDAMAVTFDA